MPIPPSARPNPVVLIAGRVYDPNTQKPFCNTDIEFHDLATNKIAGKTTSDPVDGTYKIILPYGKIYSFIAIKDSFYAESNYLDLTDLKAYQEIVKDLVLAPIKVNQVIRMNNLFFDVNKADLDPASFFELDRLIELLNYYPNMEIEISGHTDSDGSEMLNLKLSQQRADAVTKYVLSKKIHSDRLITKGYGKSKPCADNSTAFGKSLNRRVEFKILKIK